MGVTFKERDARRVASVVRRVERGGMVQGRDSSALRGASQHVPLGAFVYVWHEILQVRLAGAGGWVDYDPATHNGEALNLRGAAGVWFMCNGATVDLSRYGLGASVALPNLVDRYLRGSNGEVLDFDFGPGSASETTESPPNLNDGTTGDGGPADTHPLYNHAHDVSTTTINSAASGTPVEVVVPSNPYGTVKSTGNGMHTVDKNGTWQSLGAWGRLGARFELAFVRVA